MSGATLSEADRWRLVSAALAAVCIILGLLLWTTGGRLHATERRVLHALDGCPLTQDDLEHS